MLARHAFAALACVSLLAACGSTATSPVPTRAVGLVPATAVAGSPAPTALAGGDLAESPSPEVAATEKPAPTPVVHDAVVSVSSTSRRAFRGGSGTTEWSQLSIAPSKVLAIWTATAGSKACTLSWRLDDGYGSATAGTLKAAAGKTASASKTFSASAMLDPKLTVVTTCRSFAITMGAAPKPKPVADTTRPNCNPNYSGYCVPNVSYDLDCKDIQHQVTVIGVDVYRLDGDGDGIGCESY